VKILIVKLSAIGDVIHTLPALNALRRHWPDAHITWLVEEAAADLVLGHPALDRVLVCRRKSWQGELRSIRSFLKVAAEISRFIRRLRDTDYDLILDFQALLKSAVWIALARGRRKIGFGRGLEHMEHSYLFLTERIPAVSMEVHALERGLMLLRAIGIPSQQVDYRIHVSAAARHKVDRLLADGGIRSDSPYVAVNPMAKWKTKGWEAEKFTALADRLIETYRLQVVFTGSGEDHQSIESMIDRMAHGNRAFNSAGKTSLTELAAVFERARLVISTDTGPMHLAAALERPVVALFGPTAPWRTGPFGQIHRIVRTAAGCSPCFKRDCPEPRCMTHISVENVLEAVASMEVI
jgi:3-deoxy-D-manno-octulosonic-acid transferase/heptosyltransferase-1